MMQKLTLLMTLMADLESRSFIQMPTLDLDDPREREIGYWFM